MPVSELSVCLASYDTLGATQRLCHHELTAAKPTHPSFKWLELLESLCMQLRKGKRNNVVPRRS